MNEQETNRSEGNGTTRGFPIGNSVAVVGDPGTGKTTILLSFFRFANVSQGLVGLREKTKGKALRKFTDLFSGQSDKVSTGECGPVLRCFISLETSFRRALKNHKHLLAKQVVEEPSGSGNQTETKHNSDVFVFVDATAFLSGKLQDRLRYPHLPKLVGDSDPDAWHYFDLNLGGVSRVDEENFGLYWQPKGGTKPVRIEHIREEKNNEINIDTVERPQHPFHYNKDKQGHVCRIFNLLTPPLGDPMRRVTLLKDLLAELFVRFNKHKTRIVAVDSLSALLAAFDGEEWLDSSDMGRRLPMLNLVRWLEENEVTTMMACEAKRGDHTLSGHPLFLGTEERYLSSGVIQLDYHRYRSGDLVRYLRVLKMRGCRHDMRPHAYDLAQEGVAWIEPLFGESQEEKL